MSVAVDDGQVDLDALIVAALAAGATSHSEVTTQVLAAFPEAHRFGAAGRVAARVASVSPSKTTGTYRR